jgi:hypothetical protein
MHKMSGEVAVFIVGNPALFKLIGELAAVFGLSVQEEYSLFPKKAPVVVLSNKTNLDSIVFF